MHWKNMTGSTQERSHFLAPSVKNPLFIIIPWRHMKMSTGEENHLHWFYFYKSYAQSHARIHIGEDHFLFASVTRHFYKVVNWKHIQWHTTEKSHMPIQNVKWFVQSIGLKTHQRIDEVEEPFTCTKCGMSFTQNRVLKTHERIQTGDNLFAWSKCDK